MRVEILVAGAVLGLVSMVSAVEKDTRLAANTRTKKLSAKVSVDFKEEMLDECIKELSRQIDDAGGGSLSADYATGVSRNQRVTFDAKDQSVADVLDGICKKNSLGYFVVSKDKDRYDGWIRITRGSERGWPAGQEPKDKATAKAPPKSASAPAAKPAETPTADDPDKAEKAAQAKLEFALSLLKDGKKDAAKRRFQDIITQYPNSKAAAEAKTELDKLGG
jgi:TolA-binding protein